MSQKLIVSKVGKNVLTETSLDNIVFHSDYDTLKYYSAGSVIVNLTGTAAHGTVTHNLGYVPFFVAYVNKISPENTWSMCPQTFSDAGTYYYISACANTANLYLDAETNGGTTQLTFYYKIFRNDTGL